MKPLDERSRAVLDRYRAAEALPPDALERARAGLHASIASGATPQAGLDVPPPDPVSQGIFAKVAGSTLAKIGLGLAMAAVPTAWLLSREAPSTERAPEARAPVQVTDRSQPAPTVRAATPSPEPARIIPLSALEQERPEPPATRPSASKAHDGDKPAPAVVLGEEPPAAEDTIDEEMELLSRAHGALRSGRPGEALSAVAEHARRFPNSKLADSREVTRILSLCAAGQKAQARAAADRFLTTRPASPLTARVKNACAD